MVKIDRASSSCFAINDYYPDWLIYTDIAGTGLSGQQGMIRMAFEINLEWVKDKMPRLKEIDVNSLCDIPTQTVSTILGKRQEREELVITSKEDKIQALKDRFAKRLNK